MKGLLALGLLGLGLALLPGCKELNDNPAPRGPIRVDIAQMQRQLGYVEQDPDLRRSFTHHSDAATTQVKALVLGALVVTAQDVPYSTDTAITETISSNIEDDLTNSINYFHLTHLPSTEDYVEFDVPPPTAGQWQIVAVGLRTQPAALGNLGDSEHKDAPIYYGFDDQFNTYEDVTEAPLTLTLRRACLVDEPPKGCASYPDSLTGEPVVTPAVTIVGIKVNNASYTPSGVSLPLVVENDAAATSAISSLKTIRDEITAAGTSITNLTVVTVHPSSANETAACQGGDTSACSQQEYRVSY